MTRTGRLIRQGQRAAALCVSCGDPLREHAEYDRGDPRYRPALFACHAIRGTTLRTMRACECAVQG